MCPWLWLSTMPLPGARFSTVTHCVKSWCTLGTLDYVALVASLHRAFRRYLPLLLPSSSDAIVFHSLLKTIHRWQNCLHTRVTSINNYIVLLCCRSRVGVIVVLVRTMSHVCSSRPRPVCGAYLFQFSKYNSEYIDNSMVRPRDFTNWG